MKQVLLMMTCLMLSGCLFESEKACYEKLKADFQRDVDYGNSADCAKHSDKLGCLEYAMVAVNSGTNILLIHLDDDQNACNYYSDGPRLRRK
jgi:hypothetical protein